MNLVDSQALYSADELAQYYSIFDGEAQQLRRELLEETTAELTAAMADEFVKEARKEDWHDLLIERIGQCKSRRTQQLPTTGECELFETMLLFMGELQMHNQQLLERKAAEHSRTVACMQFQQRTCRISNDRACQQLKEQLNTKSNSLLSAYAQLNEEREEARSTKQKLTEEIARLKDEVYTKECTIAELNRKLKEYNEQLTEMDRVVGWADYTADLMRLKTYSIGLFQQDSQIACSLGQIRQQHARNRMHEALYKYIEHAHDSASKCSNMSFAEEKEAFDSLCSQLLGGNDACKLLLECQQSVSRVSGHCRHRHESQMLAHEQKQLEWERELTKKEHERNVEKTRLCNQIRDLEGELKIQGQQIAKLVNHTSRLEGDLAEEKNRTSELDREAGVLKHQLQIAEADLKMMRSVAKSLEETNECLRVEKVSLRENLALISQASNRQREEEESIRQKGIVEQVVERNFEYKLKNRELEAELSQLRGNYQRLRQDLDTETKQHERAIDALKQEMLVRNEAIERLRAEIREKERYAEQVNEKIQFVEGQLAEMEEVHAWNTELEQKCRQYETGLSEAIERHNELSQEILVLAKEKANLEVEISCLKQHETIVVEHSKKTKQGEERIIQLSEQLQTALAKQTELQEQLRASEKSLLMTQTENSQLKDKMITLMEEKRKVGCLVKVEPMTEVVNNSLGRDLNLEETLKAKENLPSNLKEKYTQSILNLNELVNFLMNCVKGYSFTGESRIREGSWVWQQGPAFLKKMQSSANLQGKLRNYLRVRQLATSDAKIRQVCDTFCGIMDGYYQRLRLAQLN